MGPAPGAAVLQESALRALRACDLVFGIATTAMALLASILAAVGAVGVATAIAFAAVPAFNLAWSRWTAQRDRVRAELVRAVCCVPLTAYIYIAEPAGMLQRQWLPALVMCVGVTLIVSIATRRSVYGCAVAFLYGAGLVCAQLIALGTVTADVMDDGLVLVVVGAVLSIVASRFGQTIDEVRVQRDLARIQHERAEEAVRQLTERTEELADTVVNLNEEMQRRRKVELELHQAQKLESVGRLASGIAHEINTPVQFVGDNLAFVRTAMADLFDMVEKLEAVRRSVDEGAPDRAAVARAGLAIETADLPYLAENVPRALDLAADGLDRVATIVRSMKEFARPDTKDMVAADLNRAVQSTITVAHNEYKYVADLVTELGDLPPVCCHVGRLNQVILNIVVNAAHAIGDVVAGTDRRGTITVRTYRELDHAVIAISDTGNGISDTIRSRVFEPFFTTKAMGRGTGQGLAIARSVVVDKHRGSLTYESEVGRGTTFYIRVPIAGVSASSAA